MLCINALLGKMNPISICCVVIFAISIASFVQFSVGISLKKSKYQYLSSDLRNMLTSYTNCHIHIFLATDDDVKIDSLGAPVYLTVPHGDQFENASKMTSEKLLDFVGEMNTPTPTAVGSCLANVFVVTQVKLYYLDEDFADLNMFMLNQRGNSLITPVVNILLMNLIHLYQGWIIREEYTLTFQGFYWNLAGSGFTIGILYDLEKWEGTTPGTSEQWDHTRKAVLTLCSHCKIVHTLINCPPGTGYDCFLKNMAKFNEMAGNGNAIRWVVLRFQWLKKRNRNKLCELPKTDCTSGDWRHQTLYEFMTKLINESLLAKPSFGNRKTPVRIRKLPRIGWTKDGVTGSLYTTRLLQIYTHRFPLEPDHQLQDNLKFITVDIVEKHSSSIFFYTTPLEFPVWLLTIFATAIITMSITATVTQLVSIRKTLADLSTTTFWVFGTITDQADSCTLKPREKSRSQAFTTLLCAAVSFYLFVVNVYKCMFSTNVIIGSEYEPRIERLDGLKDYKIFVPINEQLKTTTYRKYHTANISTYKHWLKLYAACGIGYESTSITAACSMAELMSQYVQEVPGCDNEIYDALNSKNPQEAFSAPTFCTTDAQLVVNLWMKSEFVYADEIVDRLMNMSEADRRVALVTTEEHLPVLWGQLKGKMARRPNLRFAHTMNSPRDNSTRRREHMILVSSGMKSEYTNVVARYAHGLMSSGIWSHWTGRVRWGKAIARSRTLQAYELRSDSFNRAPMVIFWTWGTICTMLLVLFGIEVIFGGKGWRYSLRYLCGKVTRCKAIRRWVSGVGRSYVWTVKRVRRLYCRT